MISEIRKQNRIDDLTEMVAELEDFLISVKAVKKAEGDEQRKSFRYSCWDEVDDEIGSSVYDHSAILLRSDAMGVNLVTCNKGIYLSRIKGDKFRTF